MTETSFGDQLQQLWRTRPARLPRQGRIAGVAAGFGHRYGIDPVLVRVAFVVSTFFGGAGLVLYLAGWLLFPDPHEGTSMAESLTGERRDSQSQTKTIVLIVALAIAVSTLGPVGVGLGGSGLIGLALMLAAWWMLYLRAPEPPLLPPGSGAEPLPGQGTTGYPGTVFPQSAPSSGGSHFTGLYTPYTKLPDHYVPDSPAPDTGRAAQAPGTASSESPSGAAQVRSSGATRAAGGTSESPDGAADRPEAPGDTPGPNLTKSTGAPAATVAGTNSPGSAAASTGADPDTGSTGRAVEPTVSTTGSTPGLGPSSRQPRGSGSAGIDMNKTTGPATGDRVPPSWDPLGVAPLAWDLPEPATSGAVAATAEEPAHSRFTPIVLGLAVLAAAGAGAAAAAGAEWMTAARIGACALAVIGLGLMLGAFRHRGHGLMAVTAPLAAFVILAAAVAPIDFHGATVGERIWTPAAATEIRPEYSVTMGEGMLDLRDIELTGDKAVDLSVQMGEAVVLVPENMNVRTECTVQLGEANCPDGLTGPGGQAPVLDLNVQVRMGSAEVRRG